MSELDVQETVDSSVDTDEAPTAGLSKEQLEAELAKVRRESAARRVKQRETDAALEELKKYKDAEKTELEKLKERAEAAELQLSQAAKEKAARAAAEAAGLDPDLAEFLHGSTEEELAESAKKLAAKAGNTQKTALDTIAGSRGEPVRPAHDSNNDAFRKLFSTQ